MNKCMQKLIYHPMALISLIFTSLLTIISSTTTTSTVTHHRIPPIKPQDAPPSSDQIRQACKATRNPQLCESSLAHSPNTNPLQIIQSAVSIASNNLNTAQSKLQSILNSSPNNPNTFSAAKTCMEYLRTSQYRINSTADVLPRNQIKDCRAWTSAGLTYQYDCLSALSYVNNAKLNDIMSFMDTLISYTSNALSMMMAYDVFGDKTASWGPPKTERDGFWERGGSGDQGKLGVPVGLKADVTVCKGGACKYVTVQGAVNAAPDWVSGRRFVVVVKAGVYKESVMVGLEKRNVVVLGEGMGKTVISGSLSVGQPGISTYNSATVGILGDGFMASNLTIENTAGHDANQAVALRIDGDQSVIENCEILGNQDTLYLHSLRHFFKSCRIQGNVDFIFGNSATIFQDCTILIHPRQLTTDKGEKSTITAHGRTDPAQTTGFVFVNSLVNGTQEYMKLYNKNPNVHISFLGRPWKEFSRTMFISCRLESLITPQGWMPWSGNFALKTLYYGEFNNSGNGSKTSERVQWSSQIPTEHVNVYSVTNFIQGDQWKLA